jgi:hypothetical protein
MPPINATSPAGVAASGSSRSVATRKPTPGSITGRKPYRSIQPPTAGRSSIETIPVVENSSPTSVLVPPSATRWSGSVAFRR